MPTCLVVGCGYVGTAFATYAASHDWNVCAVVRSHDSANPLRQRGWKVWEWDWLTPPPESTPPTIDRVLFSVSHATATSDPMDFHPRGMQHVLQWLGYAPPALFLSTTGVYGNNSPEVVNEDSPVQPTRPGSIAALAGEQFLSQFWPSPSTILRLAGIYGPQRIPNLQSLINQTPLELDPNSYLNLIHVDDIVAIAWHFLLNSATNTSLNSTPSPPTASPSSPSTSPPNSTPMARQTSPSLSNTFCVADGHPITRGDFYSTIAQSCQLPPPQFASPTTPTTNPLRRGSSNKRIHIAKLLQHYPHPLLFPNFHSGLLPLLPVSANPPPNS